MDPVLHKEGGAVRQDRGRDLRRRRGRRRRRRERRGRHLGPEHDLRLPGEGGRDPPVHADFPQHPEPFPECRCDRPRRGREEGPGRHQPRGGPADLLRPPAEGGRVRRNLRHHPAPSGGPAGVERQDHRGRPAPGDQRAVPGKDPCDEMGREIAVGGGASPARHGDPPRFGRRGVQPLAVAVREGRAVAVRGRGGETPGP